MHEAVRAGATILGALRGDHLRAPGARPAPARADLPAPIASAPFPPFAMAPDTLASPVVKPDIAAPTAAIDPFAPVAAGGLGLTPPVGSGIDAFAVPVAEPTEEPVEGAGPAGRP